MLQSMTGYGKAQYHFARHNTMIEIRSLNSKQLDLTLKAAPFFREREHDIRQLLTSLLQRGKVDVSISVNDLSDTGEVAFTPINKQAFAFYYRQLTELQQQYPQAASTDLMTTVLRMPDVLAAKVDDVVTDEEWALFEDKLMEAAEAFRQFRTQEGAALQAMFSDKLDAIQNLLGQVEPFEKARVEHIRQHLLAQLDRLAQETRQAVDNNRLEAEMIYYLEKLDITEEKVRLTNHIRYFRTTMQEATIEPVGKKLGFIAQEMGREINTLGSKSNQSDMQILVVKMKDLLEQIKEQVLNVL